MASNSTEASTDGTDTSASKPGSRCSDSDKIPAEAMARKIVHTTVRNTLTSRPPLGVRIRLDFSEGQRTLPAANNLRMPKIQINAKKPQPRVLARNQHTCYRPSGGYAHTRDDAAEWAPVRGGDDQDHNRSSAGADRLPRFIVSPLQRSPARSPQSPQRNIVSQTKQQEVHPSTPQRAQHTRMELRQLPSATPMAIRLWRAIGFKPVDGKESIASAAPKQNVGFLKNEDVDAWTPAAEQSVQDDTEAAPPPAEPEVPDAAPPPAKLKVPEAHVLLVEDNANSPMTVRRVGEDPAIRKRVPEHVPESRKVDDERTIANVSPIKTDVVSSDENSFVDKNGPWGSVSEERAHLDGCINRRIQCSGKLRQLYG